MNTKTINIAEDFSRYPSGRYVSDGLFSGEEFRNDILAPALKDNDKVIVILDGVNGYPSSFTEEAFGGLVREGLFDKEQLDEKLEIEYTNQVYRSYALEIKEYIDDALPEPPK